MSTYNPFSRGPHPVGVRTVEATSGDRTIPIEVWYPATAADAGRDVDPKTQDTYSLIPGFPTSPQEAVRDAEPAGQAFPPIVFSHGFAGHRRQTTHLCTHLASHGYVVSAPDHVGNTTAEVMAWMMAGNEPPGGLEPYVRQCAADRPRDAVAALDGLVSGDFGVQATDDGAGITGHSFGGWTTLQTTAEDDRIIAALPLAPAGGVDTIATDDDPRILMSQLVELSWGRKVPTLMIVADDDSVLPLEGMHDLLARSESIDRMVVIINADHYHFCDGAEVVHDLMTGTMVEDAKPSSELVPGAHAYDVTNGLGLAHFDAEIRKMPEAAALLERDLTELLAERGINVDVVNS